MDERALLLRLPRGHAEALVAAVASGQAAITMDAPDAVTLVSSELPNGRSRLRRLPSAPYITTLKPDTEGSTTFYHGPPVEGVFVLDASAEAPAAAADAADAVPVAAAATAAAAAAAAAAATPTAPPPKFNVKDLKDYRFISRFPPEEVAEVCALLSELGAKGRGFEHCVETVVDAEPWMAPFLAGASDCLTLVYEDAALEEAFCVGPGGVRYSVGAVARGELAAAAATAGSVLAQGTSEEVRNDERVIEAYLGTGLKNKVAAHA